MMDKGLIQSRFSKNLASYNEHEKKKKRMAERLISFITGKFDNVLEIGCGTGFLTEFANKKLEYKNYTAIDIAEGCEDFIKKINPDIDFVCQDIEIFLKESNKKYDLILSNAAFQWIDDLETFIKTLLERLNPDGILLFSTFGKENFREIFHISEKSLEYYSAKELMEMFESYKPVIEEEIHIMGFKTPKDVLRHLQLTGVNALEAKQWTKGDLLKFENNYLNLCSQRPTLTYNPIYIKIQT